MPTGADRVLRQCAALREFNARLFYAELDPMSCALETLDRARPQIAKDQSCDLRRLEDSCAATTHWNTTAADASWLTQGYIQTLSTRAAANTGCA